MYSNDLIDWMNNCISKKVNDYSLFLENFSISNEIRIGPNLLIVYEESINVNDIRSKIYTKKINVLNNVLNNVLYKNYISKYKFIWIEGTYDNKKIIGEVLRSKEVNSLSNIKYTIVKKEPFYEILKKNISADDIYQRLKHIGNIFFSEEEYNLFIFNTVKDSVTKRINDFSKIVLEEIIYEYIHLNISLYFNNNLLSASFAAFLCKIYEFDFYSTTTAIGNNVSSSLGTKSKVFSKKNLHNMISQTKEIKNYEYFNIVGIKHTRYYDLSIDSKLLELKINAIMKLRNRNLNLRYLDFVDIFGLTKREEEEILKNGIFNDL